MSFNHKPHTNIALLLCLTLLLAQTVSAQFTGRTWSAFPGGAKAVCANELDDDATNDDIDEDNDGLIEICDLEGLNAIRNNLSGSGTQAQGCPSGSCNGYELVRDLDFDDKGSYRDPTNNKAKWTTGKGWNPIGTYDALFEGNRHTISNLMIDRPFDDWAGLFYETSSRAKIVNIGLLNVQINGIIDTGGLVGYLGGTITNSYSSGSIDGDNEQMGGLVGSVDGGTIANSYATCSVVGSQILGGLVGYLDGGTIANSYAIGSVEGDDLMGGLVGDNRRGTITNSYATGAVNGTSFQLGGLVGDSFSATVKNSYWDTSTTRISTSAGSDDSDGKTTAELQSPTTATGIYNEWGTANWDYGTSSQYPVLKYAQDCSASQQPICGTLLRGQRNNQPRIISPANNTEIIIADKDAGTIKTISVTVSDEDINDELTLSLSVIEGNSMTLATAEAKIPPNGNTNRGRNEDLSISVPSKVIGGKTELQLVVEDDSGLGNARSEPISLIVTVDVNEPPKVVPEMLKTREVTIGQTLSLNTGEFFIDSNRDPLTYTAMGLPDNDRFIFSTMTGVLKVTPKAADASMDKDGLSVTVTASDGKGGSASATFKLLIYAEPSGDVEIKFNAIDDNTWQLVTTSTVVDANGIARTNYQWFRNGVLQSETSDTYPIPDNNSGRAGGTKYKVEVTYEDNIEQQTIKSDVYTVVNKAPVIDAINPIGTVEVKEGGNVSITASASDANHDELTYTWDVSSEASNPSILANVTTNTEQISFNVPTDWIKDTTNPNVERTLQLEIAVTEDTDEGLSVTRMAEVVVTKINNDVSATGLTINRDENELTLREGDGVRAIAADPDGKNSNPNELYQWQWCRTSCFSPLAWMDISDATTTTYTIPNRISDIEVEDTDRFRLQFGYTDGQGYRETIFAMQEPSVTEFQLNTWSAFDGGAKAVCKNNDIDDDNDGLIELCYLEDVNAMRYDPKGTSYRYYEDATGVVTGCGGGGGNNKCFGYELVRDLDFNDDDSYISTTSKVEWTVNDYEDNTDNGWQLIGNYNALFEGNGHTISNLMINRPGTNNVGLFGSSQEFGNARYFNISLLNVRINGNVSVGGLVGEAREGTIVMNSYVSGSVKGNSNAVGGLVGYCNRGCITNSYVSGSVSGNRYVGGLVGLFVESFDGCRLIANSYASGFTNGNRYVGGLVGENRASITNSYATTVNGNSRLGGLIGSSFGGSATNSYWDTSTTRVSTSAGGTGKTTAQLQSPTTATGIYSEWSTANWDFGTDEQYPIVKYARGSDNANPACRRSNEQSQQPVCGTVLPGQRNKPPTITLNPPDRLLEDTSTTLNVVIRDADGDSPDVDVIVSKGSNHATATIIPTSDANYTLEITAQSVGTAMITVTADDGRGTPNSEATFTFTVEVVGNQKPTLNIVNKPIPLIEIGTDRNVVISIQDANFDLGDSVTLEVTESTSSVVSGIPEDDIVINSNMTRTFTFTGLKVGKTRISFTATDSSKDQQSDTVSVLLSVFSSLALTDQVPTAPIIVPINEMYSLDIKPFFTQSGSGISYAATGLPDGLTFTGGVISGSPTTASTNKNGSVTVTASDGRGGSAEATLTLLINAEPRGAVTIGFNDITWRLTATNNVTDANGIARTTYQWYRGNTKIGTNRMYTIPDTNTGRAGGTEYKVEVTFEDNIGQSVTKSSAVYTIDNEAPVINAISQITVNEDIAKPDEPTVTINPRVTDANHDSLTYTWSVTSGDSTPSILRGVTRTNKRLQFNVPPDWIKDTTNERTLQLKIAVTEDGNGGETTTQTASVVVTKVDNDTVSQPSITLVDLEVPYEFTFAQINLGQDPDGENNNASNLNYQWQYCLESEDCSIWRNTGVQIADITNRSLTVPTNLRRVGNKFRVQILYTDGQGYRRTDFFARERTYNTDSAVKVRAKVFLEGPLQ